MMTLKNKIYGIAVALVFSGAIATHASINGWVVAKTAFYHQTADNTQATIADRFDLYINVETSTGADAGSIMLTGPGIGSPQQMTQVEPGSWELSIDYASKASMDAAFPVGGSFTLTASGGTLGTVAQGFTIPLDGYPTTPYLTGSTYSGLQSLNVYEDYPMSWNAYSSGSKVLTVFPASGGFWVIEAGVADNYTLSVGSLATDSDYEGHLEFFATSSLPASGFGGGAFRFISLTKYDIHTETPKVIDEDFGDSSRNSVLWDVYKESAERYWVEQNGRLEAISTAGVYTNDTGVWEWTGLDSAYDQNWSVTFDATIAVDETTYGGVAWIGFVVVDPTITHTTVVEQWIDPGSGGLRGVDAGAKVNGVDLGEVNEHISNQTVTLRMNYDSGKKELHASYDDGSGSWNYLASLSVTNWGMSDLDYFRILVFGGSEASALTSGDAYGDNFTFEINSIESDPEAVIPCQSIVGAWYIKDSERPTHDNVAITFLTNGIYFMCQDGDEATNPPGAVGYDGMEKGTYSWNPVTGELTNSVLEDTNAEWGFSDPPMSGEIFKVVNNEIHVGDLDVDPFVLTRVVAQTSPASLVGSWIVGNDEVVITFLHNGIYYLSHAGNFNNANPNEGPGMERGIYTWDSDTGAFTAMATVDTTGGWGLDGQEPPSVGQTIIVDGNTAHFTTPGDGEFDMYRVIDPACSDLDTDGLPDVWEQQYFSNPTNATPGGNGDGDTLDNREEFIAGTLPNDGTSFFVVSNAPPSPSGFVLNWNAVEGRAYTVLWADSLTNNFQTLESNITHPQSSYTDTVHAAEAGGFYNLKVQLEN